MEFENTPEKVIKEHPGEYKLRTSGGYTYELLRNEQSVSGICIIVVTKQE